MPDTFRWSGPPPQKAAEIVTGNSEAETRSRIEALRADQAAKAVERKGVVANSKNWGQGF